MRTVEQMITRVRRETRNATTGTYTAGASISDAEFVDALNDAQELCEEMISEVFSTLLEDIKIYTVDVSAETNPEILLLPDDCLLDSQVKSVEYSYNQDDDYYVVLRPANIRERYSGTIGGVQFEKYAKVGNQIILLDGIPTQDYSVRLVYNRERLKLDVYKAEMLTGSRSGTDFTITFSTSSNYHADVAANWDVGDTVNILDSKDNSMVVKNGVFSTLDTGAGTATVDLTDATYVAATVDAATDADLRLIEGGRTNFSELPSACQKYLMAYANMVIFERDLKTKAAAMAEKKFERIERRLRMSYMSEAMDLPPIPETDY